MIREYVIVLTDQQDKALIKKAEAAGYDDDLAYLQLKIDEMLKPERDKNHREK